MSNTHHPAARRPRHTTPYGQAKPPPDRPPG